MDVPTQRRMDKFTQYAVAAAKQAVEESGIVGTVEPERLGVYVGSGIGGMSTFVEQSNRLNERGPSRVSALFIPMMISNMAAGTIAIQYNAQGPCLPTVTACATSTHAWARPTAPSRTAMPTPSSPAARRRRSRPLPSRALPPAWRCRWSRIP